MTDTVRFVYLLTTCDVGWVTCPDVEDKDRIEDLLDAGHVFNTLADAQSWFLKIAADAADAADAAEDLTDPSILTPMWVIHPGGVWRATVRDEAYDVYVHGQIREIPL